MTKMAVIPIYGKKNKKKSLCPLTVLVDSQVSDRCPCATCYYKVKVGNDQETKFSSQVAKRHKSIDFIQVVRF